MFNVLCFLYYNGYEFFNYSYFWGSWSNGNNVQLQFKNISIKIFILVNSKIFSATHTYKNILQLE